MRRREEEGEVAAAAAAAAVEEEEEEEEEGREDKGQECRRCVHSLRSLEVEFVASMTIDSPLFKASRAACWHLGRFFKVS